MSATKDGPAVDTRVDHYPGKHRRASPLAATNGMRRLEFENLGRVRMCGTIFDYAEAARPSVVLRNSAKLYTVAEVLEDGTFRDTVGRLIPQPGNFTYREILYVSGVVSSALARIETDRSMAVGHTLPFLSSLRGLRRKARQDYVHKKVYLTLNHPITVDSRVLTLLSTNRINELLEEPGAENAEPKRSQE